MAEKKGAPAPKKAPTPIAKELSERQKTKLAKHFASHPQGWRCPQGSHHGRHQGW